MEQSSQDPNKKENGYFRLMEPLGTTGRYQTAIIILSSILAFQNGIISLGTPYYFANAPYTNCPSQYSGVTLCTQYACSLPAEERAQFLQPQISQLKTLGNEFGDYHCQKSHTIETAKGIYYFGGMVGFIVIGVLADNLGRRLSLLISLTIGVIGYLIVLVAPSLVVAEIGLFLVGFCVESCFNLVICLLSEILENSERQKMVTFAQAFFPTAGLFIVLAFYLFQYWRPIFLYFCFIPLLICLVFTYFFVQETPQFLIKRYDVKEIRQSLRFIARVNGKQQQFDQSELLTEMSLQGLKREYRQQIKKSDKSNFNYWDLFKYKSLRLITICLLLLFFCVNILYYAPLMLVDEFGFDFYLNGVIINISELATYFVGYFTIIKIQRKKLNIATALVALLCSFLLIFLHSKQICTSDCWNAKVIIQMIVVFVMRFFVSFQYQVLFVYVTQLYPVQVIGLGLGLCSVIGTVPVIFISELINLLNSVNFPVMVVFCIVSLVFFGAGLPLEETHGRQPTEKIEEIHHGQGVGDGIQLVEEHS